MRRIPQEGAADAVESMFWRVRNSEGREAVRCVSRVHGYGIEGSVLLQANEKEAIKDKAKGDVIRGLIPLIDSFDSAKASLKPETDAEKKIDAAYQVGHEWILFTHPHSCCLSGCERGRAHLTLELGRARMELGLGGDVITIMIIDR